MDKLPLPLRALAEYPHFLLRRGKMPIDPRTLTAYVAGSNWQQDITCTVRFEDLPPLPDGYGVGFLFTHRDPFFFIDIDGGIDSDIARELTHLFHGAYVETSQSRIGLHIIGRGKAPPHVCKNNTLGIELYTERRFVALTGFNATGSADADCTEALNLAVCKYFTPKGVGVDATWTNEPVAQYRGPDDDAELLQKALNSVGANATFGTRASFRDLFERNEEKLRLAYPHADGGFDESSADAALAQHLAFWTGKNCERMEHLMRQSALVRDKWGRDDYLRRTILHAVRLQRDVYQMKSEGKTPKKLSGFQYLAADQQIEHFKGCVYVQDIHKVHTNTGALLKPEQFNATYGGHVFQLDETGDKTTRRAWEAFTESQVVRYPIAQSTCFRPDLPEGELLTIDGLQVVNTYIAIKTEEMQGDVSPFLQHIEKLLPHERDRQILLSYMAACVQHRGIKFQWAPLIQGVEGNGKTLLTRCVAYAIGDKYTHFPLANEISEKFNEWLFGKLFIGVEDLYTEQRRDLVEVLKPMITNDRLAKRAMQQSQITCDNRANFMLNSNYRDAIQKTKSDRRFCVFYTAQQKEPDLTRDGMGGAYFPQLYSWLRNGGYAKVNHFLQNFTIVPTFNPAGACHRAPETSATLEVVSHSMGLVEALILDAIEEGELGFRGGWVSSVHLKRMMRENMMKHVIPVSKQQAALVSLGYIIHPHLPNGRVNNPLDIDGRKKSRLYVLADHPNAQIKSAAEIARRYVDANSWTFNMSKSM